MTDEQSIDVRAITRWLGVEGAQAGLEACRVLTVETLRGIAEDLGCPQPKSANRGQIIEQIVRTANKRIDKPLDALLTMSEDEIIAYLEGVNPGRDELLELLREMKVAPTREGQKGLINFAARELAETARFIAIASTGKQVVPPEVKSSETVPSKKTTRK